ncbi:MAG: CPBP family intramembrane glutamic endopeptidase [Polyangiales bacterium]
MPLWQAALWVLFGGLGAQLAAGSAAALVRAWLHARGLPASAHPPAAWLLAPAMLVQAGAMIFVCVLAPALAGLPVAAALGLRKISARSSIAAAVGTVALGPTADFLMRSMQTLLPKLNLGVLPMLHDLVRDLPWALSWPALALLPGVSEELMFRGLLQTAAERSGFAIGLSAIGFALFHVDPHHVVGVLPLGFFLAWVRSRCGTGATIVGHVANNSAAIAVVQSTTLDVGYGTDKPMPWQWLPVSLLITAACVVAIARETAGARSTAARA